MLEFEHRLWSREPFIRSTWDESKEESDLCVTRLGFDLPDCLDDFLELSELVMYFSSDGILGFLFEVVFVFSSEQLFSMLPLILDLVSFGESYSLITFKEHNCLLFEKSWYLFTVDNSIVSEEAALVILYIVWRNCHLSRSIYATLVVIIYIFRPISQSDLSWTLIIITLLWMVLRLNRHQLSVFVLLNLYSLAEITMW